MFMRAHAHRSQRSVLGGFPQTVRKALSVPLWTLLVWLGSCASPGDLPDSASSVLGTGAQASAGSLGGAGDPEACPQAAQQVA